MAEGRLAKLGEFGILEFTNVFGSITYSITIGIKCMKKTQKIIKFVPLASMNSRKYASLIIGTRERENPIFSNEHILAAKSMLYAYADCILANVIDFVSFA